MLLHLPPEADPLSCPPAAASCAHERQQQPQGQQQPQPQPGTGQQQQQQGQEQQRQGQQQGDGRAQELLVQQQPCRTDMSAGLVMISQEMSSTGGEPGAASGTARQRRQQQQGQQQQGQQQQGQQQQAVPRKRQRTYPWGNYPGYYGYRLGQGHEHDPRLKVLDPTWFQGADVLDIGCNEGLVTLALSQQLGARSATGVDIDEKLIRKAISNLGRLRGELSSELRQLARHEGIGHGAAMSSLARRLRLLGRVAFKAGDWLATPCAAHKYDVVTCLSVTKWVHLNCGDDGLMRMFNKVYRCLVPGGLFVLEPQPWRSYHSAVHKQDMSSAPFRHYQELKLRPAKFEEYLTKRCGFLLEARLAPPAASDGGGGAAATACFDGGGASAAACGAGAAAPATEAADQVGAGGSDGGDGGAGCTTGAAAGAGWNRPMIVFRKPTAQQAAQLLQQQQQQQVGGVRSPGGAAPGAGEAEGM